MQVNIKDSIKTFSIKSPTELINTNFDKCILATLSGYDDNLEFLKKSNIEQEKIESHYVELKTIPRINFLNNFAIKFKNLQGNVAELGVFQGDFAKFINEYFKDKTLYLFDTFEGFDERDLKNEENIVQEFGSGHFGITSIELVKNKMPYPNKVEFKKGWFPQSAKGFENERFCFVNLDADLYEPIKAGLEWFYPRLVKGGVILVHDYFSSAYAGVKKAVDEFCVKENLFALPIGDGISVMIQKIN